MTKEQSFDKRALETEADLGGMRFTMMFIKGMVNSRSVEKFKPYNIYLIWISTIEVLFKTLNPFGNYTENSQSSHPNHFIRILNIYENSLLEAIDMKLVKDVEEAVKYFKISSEINNSIFNKIGAMPRKISTLEENKELLKKYRDRCQYLLDNEIKDLMIIKNEKITQDYNQLLKIKKAV